MRVGDRVRVVSEDSALYRRTGVIAAQFGGDEFDVMLDDWDRPMRFGWRELIPVFKIGERVRLTQAAGGLPAGLLGDVVSIDPVLSRVAVSFSRGEGHSTALRVHPSFLEAVHLDDPPGVIADLTPAPPTAAVVEAGAQALAPSAEQIAEQIAQQHVDETPEQRWERWQKFFFPPEQTAVFVPTPEEKPRPAPKFAVGDRVKLDPKMCGPAFDTVFQVMEVRPSVRYPGVRFEWTYALCAIGEKIHGNAWEGSLVRASKR